VAPLALSSRIDMCSDLVGMAVVGMAGFEPAACSQNRSPALLGGARRGLMCPLAGMMTARSHWVQLSVGGRWLPTWLPGNPLALLMFDSSNL